MARTPAARGNEARLCPVQRFARVLFPVVPAGGGGCHKMGWSGASRGDGSGTKEGRRSPGREGPPGVVAHGPALQWGPARGRWHGGTKRDRPRSSDSRVFCSRLFRPSGAGVAKWDGREPAVGTSQGRKKGAGRRGERGGRGRRAWSCPPAGAGAGGPAAWWNKARSSPEQRFARVLFPAVLAAGGECREMGWLGTGRGGWSWEGRRRRSPEREEARLASSRMASLASGAGAGAAAWWNKARLSPEQRFARVLFPVVLAAGGECREMGWLGTGRGDGSGTKEGRRLPGREGPAGVVAHGPARQWGAGAGAAASSRMAPLASGAGVV
ncbi:hypothetical protein QOZ94_000624 [Xanthobacter agilis]|uniref:Uncharacterized protein n=1 Tax=Xanthobacter agilis TaxID=47492 RepID=A0ABU0L9P9_XANAG|nr:hypothetical protein [Xanthobacter agilis]